MKKFNTFLINSIAFILFTVLSVLIVIGCAQLQTNKNERGITEEEARKIVASALPEWDEGILAVPRGPKWNANVDFNKVLKSVDDKPISQKKIPKDVLDKYLKEIEHKTVRVKENGRTVRINRVKGKVRYISQNRAWDPRKHPTSKSVNKSRAEKALIESLKRLGLPIAEMSKAQVATQIIEANRINNSKEKKPSKEVYEMYRIVNIPRYIEKLPVHGSKVSATVANDGSIQRLSVRWPRFQLDPDLRMCSLESVIDHAVKEIMHRGLVKEASVTAYLAYAPVTFDDEAVYYTPSIILSVFTGPQPYQLVIPVAISK